MHEETIRCTRIYIQVVDAATDGGFDGIDCEAVYKCFEDEIVPFIQSIR